MKYQIIELRPSTNLLETLYKILNTWGWILIAPLKFLNLQSYGIKVSINSPSLVQSVNKVSLTSALFARRVVMCISKINFFAKGEQIFLLSFSHVMLEI